MLDGEMMAFDKERKVALSFGLVKTSAVNEPITKAIISENEDYRPMFMISDPIFLNSVSLSKSPLYTRKRYLSRMLTPSPHTVEIFTFNKNAYLKNVSPK